MQSCSTSLFFLGFSQVELILAVKIVVKGKEGGGGVKSYGRQPRVHAVHAYSLGNPLKEAHAKAPPLLSK